MTKLECRTDNQEIIGNCHRNAQEDSSNHDADEKAFAAI
jgi:hypothetical protein